jgi:phage terminase Nu1 subunit (DNA packaging protein)
MSTIGEDTGIKNHLLAKYITREQFAKAIDCSTRTIDRWHTLRIGPARIKRGKLILYRIEAVEEWLKSSESKTVR